MSYGVHRWLKRRSARERNICDKRKNVIIIIIIEYREAEYSHIFPLGWVRSTPSPQHLRALQY
jgi:hypothetical protein